MDDYHRWFIEKSLSNCALEGLDEYYFLYTSSSRNDDINTEIGRLNAKYRVTISKWFESQEEYKGLFKVDFVSKLLPVFLESHHYTKEEKVYVKNFDKFSTYFTGFYENRKNVYSSEEISTSIPFRIINDNLPIFIEDVRTFKKYEKVIKKIVDESKHTFLTTDLLESMFTIESFNRVLSQNGIDSFNRLLGGYSLKDGTKMQGLNELINLFNQKVEKYERLPLFVNLKKQILSDVEINGFVLDSFNTDIEMMESLKAYYETIINSCFNGELDARKLFISLNDYDLSKIYVENNMTLTGLSNEVYGGWDFIKQAFYAEYREQIKDDYETFNEWYKKQDCFSLEQIIFVLRQYSPCDGKNVLDKLTSFSVNEVNIFDKFVSAYELLNPLFTLASENKRFVKETDAIRLIKDFLDSAKEIQRFLSLTQVRASDIEKDSRFYNALLELDSKMSLTNDIYNKVRNYLTQKPYSQEKFKLNFERPTLLKGWDLNKEKDNLSVILKRDGMFYLGIMNRSNSKIFLDVEETSDDFYEKMEYKLLPGPNKMLPKLYFSKKRSRNLSTTGVHLTGI